MADKKDRLGEVLDISLDLPIRSEWYVGGYFIEEGLIKPKPPDEQHQVRFYYPSRVASLFSSFARLGIQPVPSQGKILNWVGEYGLLQWADEIDPYRPPSGPASYEEVRQAPWSVERFREEVRRARSASLLYHDLSREDGEALKDRLVAMHREQLSPKAGKLSEIDRKLVLSYGDPERQDWFPILPTAQSVLEELVEQKVSRVRLSSWNAAGSTSDRDFYELPAHWTDAFEPVQALRCPDLLSAIWLQLFLMVVGILPVRFCENPVCQTPFPKTRKDRVYCSDACRSNARHYR